MAGNLVSEIVKRGSLPPIHAQPAETLVPATVFQQVEELPQPPAAAPCVYDRSWKGVKLDPYRICLVYGITDPAIQHALKKLLHLGRGSDKDVENDVEEAIQSLERWQEMREEEA